jgi:hypothetical protein
MRFMIPLLLRLASELDFRILGFRPESCEELRLCRTASKRGVADPTRPPKTGNVTRATAQKPRPAARAVLPSQQGETFAAIRAEAQEAVDLAGSVLRVTHDLAVV